MVRCSKCNKKMIYQTSDDGNTMLICPDPECGFTLYPIFINTEQRDELDLNNDLHFDNHEYTFNRIGNINKYVIFCVDYSFRMDLDLSLKEKTLLMLRKVVRRLTCISEYSKKKILDLLKPPISFYKSVIFSLTLYLYKNLLKMEKGDYTSFQVVSMAEISEEVYRFPSFRGLISSSIVNEFIDALDEKRNDYRFHYHLNYRNFKNGVQLISNLLEEMRSINLDDKVIIYFITSGEHKSRDKKYTHLRRLINTYLEDLAPFDLNIIDLNASRENPIFKRLARDYNGFYLNLSSFNSIFNLLMNDLQEISVLLETNNKFKQKENDIKKVSESDSLVANKIQSNDLSSLNNLRKDSKNASNTVSLMRSPLASLDGVGKGGDPLPKVKKYDDVVKKQKQENLQDEFVTPSIIESLKSLKAEPNYIDSVDLFSNETNEGKKQLLDSKSLISEKQDIHMEQEAEDLPLDDLPPLKIKRKVDDILNQILK
ncbi:MAG: hypothetical protein ACTSVV_19125 [Promethearchaeota archaeon]